MSEKMVHNIPKRTQHTKFFYLTATTFNTHIF